MNVSTYLTDLQIEEIVKTISNTCIRYRAYDKQFKDLFYEPYTTMRKKASVTSAVISAFSPDRCHISGFTSQDIYYGLHNQLTQPELISDSVVLQIYSNGSDLKGKPIKEKSELYNRDLTTLPIFMIIVFSASKEGWLNQIQIKLPDVTGEIIDEEIIYTKPKCIDMAI